MGPKVHRAGNKTLLYFLLFIIVTLVPADLYAVQPGTIISNAANATFDDAGTAENRTSNTVDITTTLILTPTDIAFYQYSPTGIGATAMESSPSGCSSGGPGGPFSTMGNPPYPGIGPLDTSIPIDLVAASQYHQGEPVFIEVRDANRNIDRNNRDTVQISLDVAATGDMEELELSETGIDTGIFVGYIPSTAPAATAYDCQLSIASENIIRASYIDIFDNSDTASSTALVDPFGTVFDSISGNPVDGATVTILNSLTGLPAQVFGDDGISTFPATVTSGGTVTDSGGTLYNFPPGGYRFPFMAPGTYRIVVSDPSHVAPSGRTIAELQALPNAPFSLDAQASFGNDFVLNAGPPQNIDLPVDPVPSELFLTKSASRNQASVGDFIQYTLELTNNQTVITANNVLVRDVLPPGFRYQAGSTMQDGASGAEPTVATDGRTLTFGIGNLAPGQSTQLSYVLEVAAGTRSGEAVNSATASDDTGTTSNTANAVVIIEDDLVSSRGFILGRVMQGNCEAAVQAGESGADSGEPGTHSRDSKRYNHEPTVGTDLNGVPGIRLIMEDGRYVITDEKGMYHFEGLHPGTHVVQVDPNSIPDHMEIFECEQNTRFAGSSDSQFVDLQGGLIWRSDFYIREKAPLGGNIGIRLESSLDRGLIEYRATLTGDTLEYWNLRASIMLAEGLDFIPGSARLGDAVITDPRINAGVLTFNLGDRSATEWTDQLTFKTRVSPAGQGEISTKAVLAFDTGEENNRRTRPAIDNLRYRNGNGSNNVRRYEHRAYFDSLKSTLGPQQLRALKQFVKGLAGKEIGKVTVVDSIEITGHADNRPIAERSRHLFKDNQELSLARSATIEKIVKDILGLENQKIIFANKGDELPIADNSTDSGRARNRRVDLVITLSEQKPGTIEDAGRDDNGMQTARVYKSRTVLAGEQQVQAPLPSFDEVNTYDRNWLDKAAPGLEWLSPAADFNPDIPSIEILIKHDADHRLELELNDVPVDPVNFDGITRSTDKLRSITRWRGVDLKVGDNLFKVTAYDKAGTVSGTRSQVIHYSGLPVRAEFVEQYSQLQADGMTPVVVAVRLYDRWGKPVRKGVIGKYRLNPPYIATQTVDAIREQPLSGPAKGETTFRVGNDGIAQIGIEPTTQSGKATLVFEFDDNKAQIPSIKRLATITKKQEEEITVWLQGVARDWVMVGLAEGTAGYNTVSGNQTTLASSDPEENFYEDGRLAFYAKGRVKGKWLLTLAYDSDNQTDRNDSNNSLFQTIDPDKYYTLYGDATEQYFDAPSSEQLYVRMERDHFYAMFGDFNTELTVTELSRYSRSMTGIRTEYDGERYGINAFAAETDQTVIRDEIPGNGTSGLYRLSQQNIVSNSDKVSIQTRDRFQPQLVLETRELARYIDYNIDTINGTLFFKQPVQSKDGNFNPIYIIANYEVSGATGNEVTGGGRGHVKLMDDRLEIGVSGIHEGDSGASGNLVGGDLRYDITENTELRAEIAGSNIDNGGTDTSGNALLAEVYHNNERADARVFYRKQEADFGLGQQNNSDSGTEKYGIDARYLATENIHLNGEVYHDEQLTTSAKRDVAAGNVEYRHSDYALSTGLAFAKDRLGNGQTNQSTLLTANASRTLMNERMKLHAGTEFALDGDENVDYPSRYIFGGDYRVSPDIELFAEQEFTTGDQFDSNTSRVGFRSTPWHMATVNSSLEQQTTENGLRMFSNLGLTQGFKVNERLLLDFGIDRSQTLRESVITPFNPDVPLSSGSVDGDFTALFAGSTYTRDLWSATSRVEYRDSDLDRQRGLFIGLYRQHTPGMGMSMATRLFDTDTNSGSDNLTAETRFSVAYRPLASHWIILDRLDLDFEESTGVGTSIRNRKIVNNLNLNYMPDRRNQVALHHGIKFARDTIDGAEYDGITQTLGFEYRHDINSRWDVALHGNILSSSNSSNYLYSVGPSVGVNLYQNVWASVGYNVAGFEDDDFSPASYTAEGPYIKLRFKFGTQTLKDLVSWKDGSK